MNRRICCDILLNIFLLINFIFIETGDTIDINSSKSLSNTTISTAHDRHPIHNRERRAVRRGENNYYQRSYDLNRLKHELQTAFSAPRLKPYFHPVNEVHSYYLPKRYNKVSANVENFSDKNQALGTKTRIRTASRGEERYSVTRRISPASGLLPYDPIGGVSGGPVGQPYGPTRGQSYGQNGGQPYGPTAVQPYAPTGGQPYGPSGGQSYGGGSGGGGGGGGGSQYPPRPSLPPPVIIPPSRPPPPLLPEPQNFIRNSTYPGIPGWLRSDFPGYSTIPYTGFRCASQPYYGYYADVNAGCQVFHVCQPDGREFSFLCPNSTLYHQKVQTCDWWYNVDCAASPRYYYLNARIGVLPGIDATLFRFDPPVRRL